MGYSWGCREIGTGVDQFKVGEPVFGMINFPGIGNAYAEYVVAPADHLALKPDNISFQQAAAATLAALTAFQAFELLQVGPGDKVLINAAAGGVGHYAVQMAKHLGAYVVGTASKKNHEFVKALGADEVFDYHDPQYPDLITGIDKVLESIGGENIERSLKTMKTGGSIVCLHAHEKDYLEKTAAAKGMKGLVMVVNSSNKNIHNIAGYLQTGVIKSVINKVYSFDQIAEAHLQIESSGTAGKIVLDF